MSEPEQLSLSAIEPATTERRAAEGAQEATPAPTGPATPPASSSPSATHAPTAEQLASIEARDPYVFVEAGAGSGKTGVLVQRYCDAAESAERGADAVLAFTFTEKAAAELRARVRAELRGRAAAAEAGGENEQARKLRALARAPGAWVTTIHGFCRRLVAVHPVGAGVDPGFRVLDAAESELLAESAFDAAFEDFLADPDPARLALAAGTRGRTMLRELVRGVHDELRSLGHERVSLGPIPPPDLAGALEELASAASAALEETSEASLGKAEEMRARIATAATLHEAFASGSEPEADELAALDVVRGGKAFSGPAVAAYREALQRAVERSAADLYDALRALVELFALRYAEAKAERSGLDFEDLQLRAVALLRDSERLRESWSERFDDLLVDEFQDTNRLQVALIELLRGPETRLFTVGDEFQSIYGFRHADVRVFRAERERGRALALRGNFRSHPGVLAAANMLGRAVLPDFRELVAGLDADADDPGPATELLLVERGEWDDEQVGLADRGELDAPAERVAEAALVARRLAELAAPVEEGGFGIARGEMVLLLRAFTHVTAYEDALERAGLRPLVVGGRGYWSQQQVEDMLCLLGVVANPLEDEALLGALASPACAVSPDALWLLRRATGSRRHLWPTVRRLFGAPAAADERVGANGAGRGDETAPSAESRGDEPEDADPDADPDHAAELERRRAAAEAIPEADAERLREFCARLEALRLDAGLLPLDALVDETAGALGYDLAALQRERGQRRWANVRKLIAMARSYEESAGRDLAGFLRMLRARVAADEREPEAQTEIEGHDGVRVMTVHNAKGLEFGVVAVADLGRDLGAGGFPPAFRARLGGDGDGVRTGIRIARAGKDSLRFFEFERLRSEASEEESGEDRRLAYVAATRAERRLLLSGVVDPAAARRCAATEDPPARASVLLRLLARLGVGVVEEGLVAVDSAVADERVAVSVRPDGRGAKLELPPPATLPGLGSPPVTPLEVTLLRPSPGVGRQLLEASEPARREAALPLPEGEPTLVRAAGRPAERLAPGHLSNAVLETYARCGYRFYVERMLGLAPPGAAGTGAGAESLAFGSAVHALLEWSARNRWLEPPRDRCERALTRAGASADPERAERALELVRGWLLSPLREQIGRQARLAPEAPFLLEVGAAVVRGKLDLLATGPAGSPLVVDYKTNALGDRSPQGLMADYETQRDLYALAVADALEVEAVRTAFVFLERPDEPLLREHDSEALTATRRRLEGLVAGIAAGSFEVTDSPHRRLCHDCPARPRLCIHPPQLTMAGSPP